MYDYCNVSVLLGKTLSNVEMNKGKDEVIFTTEDGEKYVMYHEQDCCESVSIEDITGNLEDLVGAPILKAEETSNDDNPPKGADSHEWTFYNFATVKGYVTIRWLGESNGYYSESVDFKLLQSNKNGQ